MESRIRRSTYPQQSTPLRQLHDGPSAEGSILSIFGNSDRFEPRGSGRIGRNRVRTRHASLSQQSSNVLFGQSRNVLLTGSSLEGGRRTTTDDPGRARPAGGLEEGQEETDHAEAGCRGDRHHRAAGAATPAEAAAGRRPGGNPWVGWARVQSEAVGRGGAASHHDPFRAGIPGVWANVGKRVPAQERGRAKSTVKV